MSIDVVNGFCLDRKRTFAHSAVNITKDLLRLKVIINTHEHFDHVGGNEAFQQATGSTHLDPPTGGLAVCFVMN